MIRICVPSWWCERCQSWWDGSWLVLPPGEPVPDADTARPYVERSCAECGEQLVPRARPVSTR